MLQIPIQFKNYITDLSVKSTTLLKDVISQVLTSLGEIVQTLKPSKYELVLSSNQLNPLPSTKKVGDYHLIDGEFFICTSFSLVRMICSE